MILLGSGCFWASAGRLAVGGCRPGVGVSGSLIVGVGLVGQVGAGRARSRASAAGRVVCSGGSRRVRPRASGDEPVGDVQEPVSQGDGPHLAGRVGLPVEAGQGLQHHRQGAGEQPGPHPDGVHARIS